MNPNVLQGLVNDLTHLKTGWKTSEFWVALAPIVVAILGVFGVGVDNGSTTHFITIAWGAVAAVYVAGRSLLKSVHIGHAASLTAILAQIEHEGLSILEGAANNSNPANSSETAEVG